MKELKKQIMELLQQKLSVYGFKKKQQDLLIRTVKEGNVIQMIILGFAHRERHRIFFSISVGVIYKNINDEGIKFGEANHLIYYNPMECIHIGYLMPQKGYHGWYFELNGDPQAIEDNIRDVASTIIQYGFPYLKMLSNEDNLINEIDKTSTATYKGRIIPIIYHMRNEKERALQYIEKSIIEISKGFTKEDYELAKKLAGEDGYFIMAENNALKYYMEFVKNFKRILNEENASSVSKENYPID